MSVEKPEQNSEDSNEAGDSMIDRIMRERDEKRRSKMTPGQLAQEDELYKMADELLGGEPTDKIDSLTTENLSQIMNKDWPEQMKKDTIRDIMKMHLSLKGQSQETDRKLLESNKRLEELRKEGVVANENARKTDEAVKKQLRRFGL